MNKKEKQKDSLWYSAVAAYRRCPRSYKHSVIDGLPGDESSADLHFGTAMHAALYDLLSEGKIDESLGMFRIYWNSIRDQEMDYGRYNWEALANMGEIFLNRFERLHVKKYKPLMMEERIFSSIGKHKFEGTPDFVGEYEGVPSIVDFKTSAYRYDKRKIEIDDQMVIYAELAEVKGVYSPQQIVYVVFVKDANAPSIQVLKKTLTPEARHEIIQNVSDTCDILRKDTQFPKNPSSCIIGQRVCPYFNKCFGGKK